MTFFPSCFGSLTVAARLDPSTPSTWSSPRSLLRLSTATTYPHSQSTPSIMEEIAPEYDVIVLGTGM